MITEPEFQITEEDEEELRIIEEQLSRLSREELDRLIESIIKDIDARKEDP
ncbi:hypothetical protein SIID45300_02424 [Candidatus Magnetaquicoccaceae bacterium FCR-1]|uniref:Uncharacterized protein n=1 Tax=Candidatus Magnetaquiglobus chichijimensis TaxID=3141448 RepID=A0ABQ0CB08_9PROT